MGDNERKTGVLREAKMIQGKSKKNEILFQDLVGAARKLNVEVRTEKLHREVGYRAHSGSCRFKGRELIIIDREIPAGEQVALLAAELHKKRFARK